MPEEQKYVIRCDVSIQRTDYQGGNLSIREEVQTRNLTFSDMAEILELFHKLIENYKRP